MTNKNLNGNQTAVDAGEEEKCRSVLPDGEKSASEGLLKAVSMRSADAVPGHPDGLRSRCSQLRPGAPGKPCPDLCSGA